MALVLLFDVEASLAHGTKKSYSTWTLEGGHVRAELRIDERGLDGVSDFSIPDLVRLFVGGEPCAWYSLKRAPAAPIGWRVFRWTVNCARDGELEIRTGLGGDHVHIARVIPEHGEVVERVLVGSDAAKIDGLAGVDGSPAGRYVLMGIRHIVAGWDHLAFIIALLILATSLGEVAVLVTAFTVAHSLTLSLAAVGVARPDPSSVESVVAFSIALVAAENCWIFGGRNKRIERAMTVMTLLCMALAYFRTGAQAGLAWLGLAVFGYCHFRLISSSKKQSCLRAVVAFVFGLAHGFALGGGFTEPGGTPDRIAASLLGFNAGVEAGQLLVVTSVYALLACTSGRLRRCLLKWVAPAVSASLLSLGAYSMLTLVAAERHRAGAAAALLAAGLVAIGIVLVRSTPPFRAYTRSPNISKGGTA